ncbi:hypothetical protein MNBD_GAMMA03-1935 [hydrothermal vent metagenome]|uniref:AAA+ ATPase domain-containing protein n=1 Tax=hydrothermal vent metagenome TaxID=652676 RepID=A0A3B0WU43_9ZZZZ
MYRKFFGLTKLPFKSSPDLEVFYRCGSRQDILEALVYTVSRGDGITKVTGEVGSGKTMLLRLLADSLPENFTILYINTPNLSPKDMLMHICVELGLDIDGLTLKFSLLDLINKELVRLHSEGQRAVMLIDEAQAMTFDTLEEIRLLSNLETNDEKLLQIVLFGQSELDVALSNDKIRQLKSRISYSIFIPALSPEEVCSYLNYRVRKASYEGLDIFDLNVSKEIYRLSGGIPRTINMIADKLLMSAYSSDDTKVTKKHISMLPKEFFLASSIKENNRAKLILFVVLVIALLIAIGYFLTETKFLKSLGIFEPMDAIQNIKKEAESFSDLSVLKEEQSLNLSLGEPRGEKKFEVEGANKRQKGILPAEGVKNILNLDAFQSSVEPSDQGLSQSAIKIKGSALSRDTIDLHLSTVKWLLKMPNQMYIIQLASPHVGMLEEAIAFYNEQGIPIDRIHFLIDLDRLGQKNRFRVFYFASASYSTLKRIISELPPEIRSATPYIVTVGGVLKNLEYTQNNLKQNGIINVSQ